MRESVNVRRVEAVVDRYAAMHGGGADVGRPAACQSRVLGQTGPEARRRVYLELLCQGGYGGRRECAGDGDQNFLTAAVATLHDGAVVDSLSIDQAEDAAYDTWIDRRFPAAWRHVETNGPRYGRVLQHRLNAAQAHSGC